MPDLRVAGFGPGEISRQNDTVAQYKIVRAVYAKGMTDMIHRLAHPGDFSPIFQKDLARFHGQIHHLFFVRYIVFHFFTVSRHWLQ